MFVYCISCMVPNFDVYQAEQVDTVAIHFSNSHMDVIINLANTWTN